MSKLLDMIHKIKKYKEPPHSYFLRSPWDKFGTVGCGICEK